MKPGDVAWLATDEGDTVRLWHSRIQSEEYWGFRVDPPFDGCGLVNPNGVYPTREAALLALATRLVVRVEGARMDAARPAGWDANGSEVAP